MPARSVTKRPAAKNQCSLSCCTVSVELRAAIAVSVEEGRGKSMFDSASPRMHGAMCRCGVPRKPPGLAKHVADDGLCPVHPGQPPQRWSRGAGE